MSVHSEIVQLIPRLQEEFNLVRSLVGKPSTLNTTSKVVVGAINEVSTKLNGIIDDGSTVSEKTWSSQKIDSEITGALGSLPIGLWTAVGVNLQFTTGVIGVGIAASAPYTIRTYTGTSDNKVQLLSDSPYKSVLELTSGASTWDISSLDGGSFSIHNNVAADPILSINGGGDVALNTTGLAINQLQDSSGLKINGYDDHTSKNLELFVDQFGNSILISNFLLRLKSSGSRIDSAGGYYESSSVSYTRFTSSGFSVISPWATIGDTVDLGAKLSVKGSGISNLTSTLLLHNLDSDSLFRVLDNGDIGMGIDIPLSALDIRRDVADGATLTIGTTGTNAFNGTLFGGIDFYNSDADNATEKVGAFVRAYTGDFFGSGGHLTFGTLTEKNHAIPFTLYERMRITSTGYIGFNTTVPNSTVHIKGSFATEYVLKSANYLVTDLDHTIECTANTFTVTLPLNPTATGREYSIGNSGNGIITLDGNGKLINGVPFITINNPQFYTVKFNGTSWIIV